MDYTETKKMQEFVNRIFEATDLIETQNPADPRRWKRPQTDLWGWLDELATDMMNQVEWDEAYIDEVGM